MTSGIELVVSADTTKFASDDQRWLDQVALLRSTLHDQTGAVSRRGVPAPGAKGALEATILAVGSSGALAAVVACFRAWLARDKTRTLTVTWTDDQGMTRTMTLSGKNLDQASFQALAEAAGKGLGGS
ncbi:hypothetical protein NPS70_01930 [Streptomyces sp. C10-9-1]|uniref:effector-associated constant component EACC1 n=1 Tax=Streptomyces sp. C10-9-1 TaxID=1859285 RepID=UPI0021121449|nr:hypothetical protein [Streptomyces sp. C10-9-1]MCQ6551966.1 hypothetical protein [Streptomyces sp. C10-9-1]